MGIVSQRLGAMGRPGNPAQDERRPTGAMRANEQYRCINVVSWRSDVALIGWEDAGRVNILVTTGQGQAVCGLVLSHRELEIAAASLVDSRPPETSCRQLAAE